MVCLLPICPQENEPNNNNINVNFWGHHNVADTIKIYMHNSNEDRRKLAQPNIINLIDLFLCFGDLILDDFPGSFVDH
jgi:hypothetical protein